MDTAILLGPEIFEQIKLKSDIDLKEGVLLEDFKSNELFYECDYRFCPPSNICNGPMFSRLSMIIGEHDRFSLVYKDDDGDVKYGRVLESRKHNKIEFSGFQHLCINDTDINKEMPYVYMDARYDYGNKHFIKLTIIAKISYILEPPSQM